MKTTWKYVKPLEDSRSVEKYLDKYKITLPKDIISVLTESNGGRPQPNNSIITESQKEYVFKALLSYNKNDRENIYNIYPALFENTSLYPIGSDTAGNFLCFDTDSKKYVLWIRDENHETAYIETVTNMPFLN